MMVPAIMPRSRVHLDASLSRLRGVTSSIQIDIVDGIYAGPQTWPLIEDELASLLDMRKRGEFLPCAGTFMIEVDLMVSEPERIADLFIDLGANRIVLHFGSARDLGQVISNISSMHGYQRQFAPNLLSIGVALSLDTPVSVLKPFIESIDFVQLMGIQTIGKQGEPFSPLVIERAREVDRLYNQIQIQIDGGVSLQNAPDLLSAGVDRLVVGSHFWESSNLQNTYDAFEALGEQYGLYS